MPKATGHRNITIHIMLALKNGILAFVILVATGHGNAQEQATWPDFRGLSKDGIVRGNPGLPLNWSEKQNIAWKTAIAGRAWSSPVIAEGKIWLSNATKDGKGKPVLDLFRTFPLLISTFLK